MGLDLLKREYILKYKDENVIRFIPAIQKITVINRELLPFCIQNDSDSYDMIQKFCGNRVLMFNRENCKELLTACGIDDQTPVNICLVTNALSFTDNYWICLASHNILWKDMNLHHNNFSLDIPHISLTGNLQTIVDNVYTGELSVKGTRAKGIFRENDQIVLYKHETMDEINSEVISYYIANILGLLSSKYSYKRKFDLDCSKCTIQTNEKNELLSCRDIMLHFGDMTCGIHSQTYNYFMTIDPEQFILMQIFDYLTLNVDRNRDNYGILKVNGNPSILFPLFDHDSCFKGMQDNAHYFVTASTFAAARENIKKAMTKPIINALLLAKHDFQNKDFLNFFQNYKSEAHYNAMMHRLNTLIGE